jgi:8-amino-7-oxononanoate synthase
MSWLESWASDRLSELDRAGLRRRFRTIEKAEGPWVVIDGRRLLCFCSNDYLGLSERLEVKERLEGTGGSRLLCGTRPEHVGLERRMARFKGRPCAMLFNSAYLANMGLMTSIADSTTTVFSDELNHASLIDAIRLSRARVSIYPHADAGALDRSMSDAPGRKIIVTESLFSMDGDPAPLAELADLAGRREAALVIDDTHATGIVGERGRGTALGDAVVCNLAKAGGMLGGFVLGSEKLIELLTTTARTMVFTTSWPAGLCRAAMRAIDLMEQADEARARLRRNIERLAAGLGVRPQGPIFPIVLGDRAVPTAERLFDKGFFLPAIRPPTVPEGTARLRISLTALHEPEHIDALLAEL